MQRYRRLTILALFVAASLSSPVPGATLQASEPQNVSMIQLLATPERFHGKTIRVVGFRVWALEESVVYLHSEDAEYRTHAIWLALDSKKAEAFAAATNYGYCVIEGEFDAHHGNSFASIPTSIKKITRIERVRPREEMNVGPRPRPTPR